MLYFLLACPSGEVIDATSKYPGPDIPYLNRNDFLAFSGAERIAAAVNALPAVKAAGDTYIATDAGDHVSPRYDVIRAPKVGDAISYGFNGDAYPDGEIVKISASLRIVTSSSGKKYSRRHKTGAWLNHSWALIHGHHDKRNPHF